MDGRPPSHTGLIVPNATAHKYGNAPAPASHKCLNWFMTISFIANIFSSHCIYARHTFIIIRKFVRWCSIVVGCCSLPLWFIHRFVRFCVVVIVVVFFFFIFIFSTHTNSRPNKMFYAQVLGTIRRVYDDEQHSEKRLRRFCLWCRNKKWYNIDTPIWGCPLSAVIWCFFSLSVFSSSLVWYCSGLVHCEIERDGNAI